VLSPDNLAVCQPVPTPMTRRRRLRAPEIRPVAVPAGRPPTWIVGTVQGYRDGTGPDGLRFDVRDDEPGAPLLTVTIGPDTRQDVRQAATGLQDGSRVYIRLSPARERILEIRPL
jgi:hypothetical protein